MGRALVTCRSKCMCAHGECDHASGSGWKLIVCVCACVCVRPLSHGLPSGINPSTWLEDRGSEVASTGLRKPTTESSVWSKTNIIIIIERWELKYMYWVCCVCVCMSVCVSGERVCKTYDFCVWTRRQQECRNENVYRSIIPRQSKYE